MKSLIHCVLLFQTLFLMLHAEYGDADCNGDQILAFHHLDHNISSITNITSGTPTIDQISYQEATTSVAVQFKAAAVLPGGCATTATDCIYVMYDVNSVTYLGTLDAANHEVIRIGSVGSLPLTAMSFDCFGNLRAIHAENLNTYIIDTTTGAATVDTDGTGLTSCKNYYDCTELMAYNSFDGAFWRVSSSSGTDSATPVLCEGIEPATESCVTITDPDNVCSSSGNENKTDISAMSYIEGGGAGTPGFMLISCTQIGVTRTVLLNLSDGIISDIGYGTNEINVGDFRMSGLVNLDATGTGWCSAAACTHAPSTPAPITPSPTTPAPVTPAPVTPAPSTPFPTTPTPTTPAPTTPAPTTPAPITPAPVTPAPSITATDDDSSDDSESSNDSYSDSDDFVITATGPDMSDEYSVDEAHAITRLVVDTGLDNDEDDVYTLVVHVSNASIQTLWIMFGVFLVLYIGIVWWCLTKRNKDMRFVSSETSINVLRL
eukprot:54262_1